MCGTSDGREPSQPLCGAPAPNTRRCPDLETPLLRPCSSQSPACCFGWLYFGFWTAFVPCWPPKFSAIAQALESRGAHSGRQIDLATCASIAVAGGLVDCLSAVCLRVS